MYKFIILKGFKRDTNGNKIVTVRPNDCNLKAFNIQTNSNLPLIHKFNSGFLDFRIEHYDEVLNYVKSYGTKSQQTKIIQL